MRGWFGLVCDLATFHTKPLVELPNHDIIRKCGKLSAAAEKRMKLISCTLHEWGMGKGRNIGLVRFLFKLSGKWPVLKKEGNGGRCVSYRN
jgi:hypothetical protein